MWASLIIALLSFFMMKKSGSSDTSAMVTAGLAGAGSYYVATETEWGQENLSWFEDSTESQTTSTTPTKSTTPVLDSEGNPVKDSDGNVIYKMIDGTADVLKSWGGTGTAAVVGTTALAANSSLQKYLPWVLLGLGVYMVVK